MENNKFYSVKNRSASQVCYRIPEDGIRRTFAPGEAKRIAHEELEKLTWQAGGRELLADYLQIQEEKALEDLGIHTEPEYSMNEEQIKELLLHGSLDAFLDALDFAPSGVIELMKIFAVSLPLTDYDKRKAMKNKTGFDVDAALKNIEAEKAEDAKPAATPSGRRVAAQPTAQAETAPARRTSGATYKVIDKK